MDNVSFKTPPPWKREWLVVLLNTLRPCNTVGNLHFGRTHTHTHTPSKSLAWVAERCWHRRGPLPATHHPVGELPMGQVHTPCPKPLTYTPLHHKARIGPTPPTSLYSPYACSRRRDGLGCSPEGDTGLMSPHTEGHDARVRGAGKGYEGQPKSGRRGMYIGNSLATVMPKDGTASHKRWCRMAPAYYEAATRTPS